MLNNFLLYAILGGLGVAILAGPLGAVVVWRRMAYFGDTLAHSALLGISLSILMSWSMEFSIIGVCTAIAFILSYGQKNSQGSAKLSSDTWLGILAHSSLALGLVVITYLKGVRVDLFGFLFGDILALNKMDLFSIYAWGIVVIAILILMWRSLIAWVVDEELAMVEGVPVARVRLLFMVLIALVIAVAMKIVGVLLITSMMIIPAATARHFARTPEMMAISAAIVGGISVLLGLFLSYVLDIPAGPAIVVCAGLLFVGSFVFKGFGKA